MADGQHSEAVTSKYLNNGLTDRVGNMAWWRHWPNELYSAVHTLRLLIHVFSCWCLRAIKIHFIKKATYLLTYLLYGPPLSPCITVGPRYWRLRNGTRTNLRSRETPCRWFRGVAVACRPCRPSRRVPVDSCAEGYTWASVTNRHVVGGPAARSVSGTDPALTHTHTTV